MLLDAVEPHPEPQGNAVAGEVARGAMNFDALHAELAERDLPKRPDGGGDDAPVLVLLAEPVTDFDGAGGRIGRFESGEPGEEVAVADGIDRVGGIGERGTDERPAVLLAAGEGDERQPYSEVGALSVDGAENIAGVVGLQRPEGVGAEKGNHSF